MAENDLKKEVKKAVITVPAYFDNDQRESTKIASDLIIFLLKENLTIFNK